MSEVQPFYQSEVINISNDDNNTYPIKSIESGRLYKSVKGTSPELNVCKSSIRQVYNGTWETAGGNHFENAI